MSEANEARQRTKRTSLLGAFCLILLTAVIIMSVLFFTQNRRQTSTDAQKSERIIQEVGKLYVLPAHETPTVAEIRDKTNLPKDQEFYNDAENGDFVLVYTRSKIAFLYRESLHKLVRVSPVVPASTSTDQAGSNNETP
jgi:hypothetical protein